MLRFRTIILVLLLAADIWAIITSFQEHRALCLIAMAAIIVITFVQLGSSKPDKQSSGSARESVNDQVEYIIDNRTGKTTNQVFYKSAYPDYSVLRTVGNQTDYYDSTGSILSTIRMKNAFVPSKRKTLALHRTGYLITMLCLSALLVLLAVISQNSTVGDRTTEANSYNTTTHAEADANATNQQAADFYSTTMEASETGPENTIAQYIIAYADARTNSDIGIVAPYVEYGSTFYNNQKSFIEENPARLDLEDYEIVSVDYLDEKNCIVSTNETYYVQGKTKKQLVTQACKYCLEKIGGEWLITDYADIVKVLQKIDK